MSEQYQYRVTEDGVIHKWRRGEKPPPEARRNVCPHCLESERGVHKLQIEKPEFSGKKGKTRRDYVCSICGYKGLPFHRQRRYITRGNLKEPER